MAFPGEMQLERREGGWVYDIPGSFVSRLLIDFRLGIYVARSGARRPIDIAIGSSFALLLAERRTVVVPGITSTVGPMLNIFKQTVNSILIEDSGVLKLTLSGVDGITVEPDAKFEAWELADSSQRFICKPGGGVVIYG